MRGALALACWLLALGAQASPAATCLNASRRAFSGDAQLRVAAVRTHPPQQVYAFDVLDAEPRPCVVRGRVNTRYAVRSGLQGAAQPEFAFDLCLIRKQLHGLRRLPSLLWNGTAPQPSRWRAAIARHDDGSRQRFVETMVEAHVAYAQRARRAGVADAAAQHAWRSHASCAVVGGAPSLVASELGAEIDAHEAVLRFNDHPVGGAAFARFVGNRTTYLLLNALHAGARMPADPDRVLLQVAKNGRVFEAALAASPRRRLLEPEVLRTFYEHFGSGGLTGSLGVWFALAACERVSLYGFSSPCELGTKYRHYYQGGGLWARYQERVQVNTVKVALWVHALRCAGMLRWSPPQDGDGDHWCSAPSTPAAGDKRQRSWARVFAARRTAAGSGGGATS